MGFGDIASLVGAGAGALNQSANSNNLLAQTQAFAAKQVAAAQANQDEQQAQRAANLKLGTAFSQLANYQAQSAGNSSVQFTKKLGAPGGGANAA
jgi:hypothetical protein